jgi:L-aminopeptidase/D-esterase-like protein
MTLNNSITDIPGIRVGHAQDNEAVTGCTVILCETGAVAGIDQRGGAPGTRETDALSPMHLVQQVHAVVLTGGSAFGLEAAGGVVRYLEEKGVGFDVGVARVPIVPAAVLFDLNIGDPSHRPDHLMGYQACLNSTSGAIKEGSIGAGTGATVGKILGLDNAMKAGIGSASIEIGDGLLVGAIAATNAFGDVVNPQTSNILAGARVPGSENSIKFVNTLEVMRELASKTQIEFGKHNNTVIGVVATNAKLNKEEINKVAQMAQDGLARCIRPAHTMLDGDTIFALSIGDREADVNTIGAFAADAFSTAVIQSIQSASPAGGVPSISSFKAD